MDKDLILAKKIIKEEVEKAGFNVVKIILFGSRARGEYKKDSDYDFFVVIDSDIEYKKKWEIILNIKRKLAKKKIPNDIIIKSKREEELQKNDVGAITYYALRDGILI